MKRLTATILHLALAVPVAAGPLDTLQYRVTLHTDRPIAAGFATQPWETAYLLADSPAFGVVVTNSSEWGSVSAAYPRASFSLIGAGGFTPFVSTMNIDSLEIVGGGEYTLGMEFRDAAGHQSVLSFTGSFFAQWWSGHGYASPVYLPPDHQGGPGGPPSGSFWLGGTRYNVQLGYGSGGPYYTQDADGNWGESWYAVDPVPFWDGGYWREDSGRLLCDRDSGYARAERVGPRCDWFRWFVDWPPLSSMCSRVITTDLDSSNHSAYHPIASTPCWQNMVRVESSESNFLSKLACVRD